VAAVGTLGGIARRGRSRGPIQTLDAAAVTTAAGVEGDFRGKIRPGGRGRRQISLLEAESWAEGMADLGLQGEAILPWMTRRANLLTHGLRFPRRGGYVVAIGESLRIEITVECDPCSRMDEVRPGLFAALVPDWRGGLLGKVISDGKIAIGDTIRIES
jgi:MOSC domain-containing protein YiiM